ncbi:MAG TPA: Stf0 family sulfotransferase [Mycobacteriales bacterium]|nr:Stf0 family sulfotransferase [Mycobacteriales bacterium]
MTEPAPPRRRGEPHQGPFRILAAPDPRGTTITTCGLVATLPRSGSWLLSDALASTGLVGQPAEFFRPDYLAAYRRSWGLAADCSTTSYVEAAIDRTASDSGIFTAKLHWYQFEWLCEELAIELGVESPPTLDLIAPYFPQLRVIRLTRRDRARQALSYYVAIHSQRWFDHAPPAARLTDDPDWAPDLQQVRFLDDALANHESCWERVLASASAPTLTVAYEDLVADRELTLTTVLRFLGVEADPQLVSAPAGLSRQAGKYTDMWVRRYEGVRDLLQPLTSAHVWSDQVGGYVPRDSADG